MLSAEAWQCLLAAELSVEKSRALMRGLGSSRLDPQTYLLEHPALSGAEKTRVRRVSIEKLHKSLELGARIVEEAEYPEVTANVPGLPPALFAWGDFSSLCQPTIAIVGTRMASTYGKSIANRLAVDFARAGVTVVSGGAHGIDSAAHKGALEVGGRTVAVFGTGIDESFPASNQSLFRLIREQGCLVSQFAVGCWGNSYKFLVRNGLIAALSRAVVVVEAPTRSGSLVTAHAANLLGRQVFVVPATVDHVGFVGSFELIRDGATLVVNADQVLEAMGLESVAKPETPVLEGPAAILLSALTADPIAPEFLSERTGIAMDSLMAELTMLELSGQVVRASGGYAIRQ